MLIILLGIVKCFFFWTCIVLSLSQYESLFLKLMYYISILIFKVDSEKNQTFFEKTFKIQFWRKCYEQSEQKQVVWLILMLVLQGGLKISNKL